MKQKMLRITEEAHAAIFNSQKAHETFSETILRLHRQREEFLSMLKEVDARPSRFAKAGGGIDRLHDLVLTA